MIGLLFLVTLAYAGFTLLLWRAFRQLPTLSAPDAALADRLLRLSVVVPVRNEAATLPRLLDDLVRQTYTNFEVIVVDDASTDATPDVARAYQEKMPVPLRLISLPDQPTTAPKKRAIAAAIGQATGDCVVTTDGDCRVGPRWLETLANAQAQTGAALLSGPVTFLDNQTWHGALQTVEFSSLIGAGAATLALGLPTMCNGANLLYQKSAFDAVNGFAGVDHVASGDDELLMHKIAARFPGRVHFVKQPDAIVQTHAHRSWGAFYRQRKRWASKWRTYADWRPSAVAVFVFAANVAPVVAVVGALAGGWGWLTVPVILLLKYLPEFLFLRQVLVFLQKRRVVFWIPLTQLVYPLYVIFFGLAAQGRGYRWKNRHLK